MRRDSHTPSLFFQRFLSGELVALFFVPVFGKRRTTMTQTETLEIVWRNPKPPQRWQRWEQVTRNSASGRYLLQELISTPVGSFWATTSSLEILRGGRAA
jgi:hypothetical protein